jgi:flagellar biosynthesis protein FlhF
VSTPAELLQAMGREAGAGRQDGALAGAAVRTYRGRSVEDVIPLIQQDLGAEAIIVRRRDGLTGGVLGFFQHPFVEIEAMPGGARVDVYDEAEPALPPQPAPPPPAQSAPQPRPQPALERPAPPIAPPPPMSMSRERPEPPPRPAPWAQPEPPPAMRASPRPAGSAYVTAHLAALARAERTRNAGLGVERAAPPPSPPPAREEPGPAFDFHELFPREEPERLPDGPALADYSAPPRRETPEHRARPRRETPERRAVAPGSHARARAGVEKGLRRFGIGEELARELIEGATAHTLALAPRSGLAQAVRTTLAQRIPVAPPLPTQGAAIVVVGAGGAGKTTCCAALLGAYRKSSTLHASFATLIAGAERGELGLLLAPQIVRPMAAGSPRALRALRRAKGDGLAILDTPRLSPADKAGIRALAAVLGELAPERIVVALPATLGAAAAAQLLSALTPLGANALAVTHADETDQLGVAVEAACRFGLAPEYMLDRARSGGWRLQRLDSTELAGRLLP